MCFFDSAVNNTYELKQRYKKADWMQRHVATFVKCPGLRILGTR